MAEDEANDALLALQKTLSGTTEALMAFVECADSGMVPPASLIDAAKRFIDELHRYVNGIKFDGSH